jgi:Putative peptidoglycan binding domain
MKNLTSLLICCSLALAGAALAQQPNEQPTPKGKHAPEKAHPTEAQPKPHAAQAMPGANAAKPEAPAAKQHGAMKEHGATNEPGATTEPGAGKGRKARATQESATAPGTNVSGESVGAQTPSATERIEQRRKGMKGAAAAPKTSATPATAAGAASATPSVATGGQINTGANATAGTKKADPQKVQQVKQQTQQIKQQNANFRAQPRPDKVPAVTFNQNYRIQGSDQWQGTQYQIFRSYHPERHDQGWYRSRYNRVELIGGGYYFWNNGYWFPAWGYSPAAEYYAYDGPIYVGQRAEPPDRVIADVQAELQQMGYYQGEVDGLLGPLTRQALADYQADQGLTQTEAIDQPTLDSLGMS